MAIASDIIAALADYAHGRVPRAIRERQILALAEDLFAEHGYANASMDELARRAGVSKPVIYALVGSKERLYRRCVERHSEMLATRIATEAGRAVGPEAQLRAGILAFFTFVNEHRRVWEALTWDATPFADEAAAIRKRQTELAVTLLADAAARLGAAPDPLQIDAIAHAVNGSVEALARWWRDHQSLTPEQLTDMAVDLLLPGLVHIVDVITQESESA
jgi:AcrR family transcriptional regulator